MEMNKALTTLGIILIVAGILLIIYQTATVTAAVAASPNIKINMVYIITSQGNYQYGPVYTSPNLGATWLNGKTPEAKTGDTIQIYISLYNSGGETSSAWLKIEDDTTTLKQYTSLHIFAGGGWATGFQNLATMPTRDYPLTIRAGDTSTGQTDKFTFTIKSIYTPIPSGYFLINGVDTRSNTTLYLSDPTITVGFNAVKDPDYVTAVGFTITKNNQTIASQQLNKVNQTYWETTYTFPSEGTFLFEGYFKDTAQTYTASIISVTWLTTQPTEIDFTVIGTILLLAGLLTAAIGLTIPP